MNRQQRAQKKKLERQKRLQRERNELRNRPVEREDRRGDHGHEKPEAEQSDPLNHAYDTERLLRALHRAMAGRNFESEAAMQAFVARYTGRKADEIGAEALAAGGREAAQELVFQAMEARFVDDAERLAEQALEIDPDCCDALALLATIRTHSLDAREASLTDAVERGARSLGAEAFTAENRGEFWSLVQTRPYMRARAELCRCLVLSGKRDEALVHARELVALDRDDHLDVRFGLIGLLLEHAELVDEARELLDRFEHEASPTFAWARVLERFVSGDRAGATNALGTARKLLPHFEQVLGGEGDLSTDDELRFVSMALSPAWLAHAEAHRWILEGALRTTAEERRIAIESYRAPVADLLRKGDIHHRKSVWPDYVAQYGLSSEHTPELIRMASDWALHEHSTDDPAVWAPIHAMRALGQLRAESAIGALIEIGRTFSDDDWLELQDVFALIGPAAIEPLVDWLRDARSELFGRAVAAESLWHIGKRRPESRRIVVGELSAILLHHDHHDPTINGFVVLGLIELGAVDLAPLIQEACEDGDVDPEVAGEWKDIERRLRRDATLPNAGCEK